MCALLNGSDVVVEVVGRRTKDDGVEGCCSHDTRKDRSSSLPQYYSWQQNDGRVVTFLARRQHYLM